MRKVAYVAALVSLPLLAQQPTPAPASLVREGVTEKLTSHVWAIPDGSASLVPNVGTEIIAGYRAYLTRIRDRAAQLKLAGKSPDEAVQAITDEMVAQYPDRNRLAGAIRAAYAEAK